MARVRSPNYPAISLSAALEKIRVIHKGEGRNAVAREVLAKLIGYGGLNGGSATMLSALAKYGLLESVGEGEARVSDLSMRILFPEGPEEKQSATEIAAFKPAIFAEIREKWPDRPPGDESLRAFLGRKGFTESALEQVIQFYREIIDMAFPAPAGQIPPVPRDRQEPIVQDPVATAQIAPRPLAPPLQGDELPPTLQQTITSGKPFTVAFDGAVLTGSISIKSVRDIDRLMKVLQAQKAAFEAMQDDESEEALEE